MAEKNLYKIIGSRARQLRENRNLSQDYVAKKLGYSSRVTVSKIEKGSYTISAETLKKMSDIFQVPMSALTGEEERELTTKKLIETLMQDKELSPSDIDKIVDFINFLKRDKK